MSVRRAALLALAALAGCHEAAAPREHVIAAAPGAAGLDAWLGAVCAAHADEGPPLLLPREAWQRLMIPTLASWYDTYALTFYAPGAQRLAPALAAYCTDVPRPPARPHFAGDRALSNAQTRLRWTVPALAPSFVVPGLDTVFVHDGTTWRALVGVDALVTDTIGASDPACAADYQRGGPPGECTELIWMAADGALAGDRARLQRACTMMHVHCAGVVSTPHVDPTR